jgi:hypothetical protein
MALYQRAEQYVKEALEASNASYALDSKLSTELQTLKHNIEGNMFSAHAHSVLEGEGVQDEDGGSIQVGTKTNYRSKKVCISKDFTYTVQPRYRVVRMCNIYKNALLPGTLILNSGYDT